MSKASGLSASCVALGSSGTPLCSDELHGPSSLAEAGRWALPLRQLSLLVRSFPMCFPLVSFLLLVFNIGVFIHKKKILGLWPHCLGVRSRQVKKTYHLECE